MYPSHEQITDRLKAARESFSLERNRAAEMAGIADETLAAYEGAKGRGKPKWVLPIQYMAFLAGQTAPARREILALLGIEVPETSLDPELQRKLDLVKSAHGHESRAIRALLNALEELLRELGEGEGA